MVWWCKRAVAGTRRAPQLWETPLPVIWSSPCFFHYTCVLFRLANTVFAQSGIHSGVLTWSLLGSKLTKLYLTISKVHNTAAKYRTDKGSPWNSTGMGIKSMSFLTVPWQAFARRGLSVPASDSQVFLGASCREQLDPWTDPSLAKTLLPPCRDWTCSPMWDCGLEMCSGAACIGILFSLNYIVSLCTFQ